jgi:hypothetical protein
MAASRPPPETITQHDRTLHRWREQQRRAGRCSPEADGSFATEAREYWARIGHGFDVINYDRSRIRSAQKGTPDKAFWGIARR